MSTFVTYNHACPHYTQKLLIFAYNTIANIKEVEYALNSLNSLNYKQHNNQAEIKLQYIHGQKLVILAIIAMHAPYMPQCLYTSSVFLGRTECTTLPFGDIGSSTLTVEKRTGLEAG